MSGLVGEIGKSLTNIIYDGFKGFLGVFSNNSDLILVDKCGCPNAPVSHVGLVIKTARVAEICNRSDSAFDQDFVADCERGYISNRGDAQFTAGHKVLLLIFEGLDPHYKLGSGTDLSRLIQNLPFNFPSLSIAIMKDVIGRKCRGSPRLDRQVAKQTNNTKGMRRTVCFRAT